MRRLGALIFLAILACAALASHQRKPFELRIDANHGAGPTNAAQQVDVMPQLLVTPCPRAPQNSPILEAERKA